MHLGHTCELAYYNGLLRLFTLLSHMVSEPSPHGSNQFSPDIVPWWFAEDAVALSFVIAAGIDFMTILETKYFLAGRKFQPSLEHFVDIGRPECCDLSGVVGVFGEQR